MLQLRTAAIAMLCCGSVFGQSSPHSIIPEPSLIQLSKGNFNLAPNVALYYNDAEAKKSAELFREFVLIRCGFKLKLINSNKIRSNSISFRHDISAKEQAYELTVEKDRIKLAGKSNGLFYGVQTLQQLIPLRKGSNEIHIPVVSIQDSPRFDYRGLMLDVSRHFFSVPYLKRFLDVMAHFKMNKFHWHLTDDQGWRMEIKRYPKLQTVAAWREPTEMEKNSPYVKDRRYGGFYTQSELKEVIAYAAKRHITVIPEIEMPGHSSAALTAYPKLGCTGGPYTVQKQGGVYKDVYCGGKDLTFEFLQNVLSEVIDVFPSEYIHIGGDETPKDNWIKCPHCQSRIKREGLKDEHELQSYFVQRIEKFVNSKGRKIIGWDEILEGGLAPNATVMSWRGESGGIAAARQKHDAIMSPYTFLYFDYYQSNFKSEPPAFPALLPLQTVYGYEPLSESLRDDEHKYIKGVQGNTWTEMIVDEKHVDYMVYPRALAASEIGWSAPSKKDYTKFLQKLSIRLADLDARQVSFRIPEPEDLRDSVTTQEQLELDFKPSVQDAIVYYTLDGTDPSPMSKRCGPFRISLVDNEPVIIKAMTVLQSGRQSRVYSASYTKKAYKAATPTSTVTKGLAFKSKFGIVQNAKEINISRPDTSGIASSFSTIPFGERTKFYVQYEGYLHADEDAVYKFKVKSDDGAVLYLDDEITVDNDGEHGPVEKQGVAPLRKGYHKIRLQYFDSGGGKHLSVSVEKNGKPYSIGERLFH